MTDRYEIVRFFKDEDKPAKVMMTGLTLKEAREHCKSRDTHGKDWFDGYRKCN